MVGATVRSLDASASTRRNACRDHRAEITLTEDH